VTCPPCCGVHPPALHRGTPSGARAHGTIHGTTRERRQQEELGSSDWRALAWERLGWPPSDSGVLLLRGRIMACAYLIVSCGRERTTLTSDCATRRACRLGRRWLGGWLFHSRQALPLGGPGAGAALTEGVLCISWASPCRHAGATRAIRWHASLRRGKDRTRGGYPR
jgi:hypothetical protein